MWSVDGSGSRRSFVHEILDGALRGAYARTNDGQWVLKHTESFYGSINTIPQDWEMSKIAAGLVYVEDYHRNPVIASTNGCFGMYWPAGRP